MSSCQVIALPEKSTTTKLVSLLKQQQQDFEFYPTTSEIIATIRADIRDHFSIREDDPIRLSVLDCGSGDGRVLNNLTQGDKYAIEKSQPLLSSYGADIFIVGTDFTQQTLIDKNVDILFSNPPYEQFEQWAYKIIMEANAACIYLVIPLRWTENDQISQAIKLRKANVTSLGQYDFFNADRSARAKVDVIRITLAQGYYRYSPSLSVDPFDLWFENHFKIDAQKCSQTQRDIERCVSNSLTAKVKGSSDVVKNDGLVNVLERFYQADMSELMDNYRKLSGLDPVLLKELNVEVSAVKGALKLKIQSHKSSYWQELFNNLTSITGRLCASAREGMLAKLQRHTHIDFTTSNAHAVALWVVKNANNYFDSQLIELVERMVSSANVVLYVSNQRTFKKEDWRYNRKPKDLSHYALDYRVVLTNMGGIVSSYDAVNGLSKYAASFIDDIAVVAGNIGFDTDGQERCRDFEWSSKKGQVFHYFNHETGQKEVLFEVKAFLNGNLHVKMNQAFLCKLNVEFGRLKGWLKCAQDAVVELALTEEESLDAFRSNYMLTASKLDLLGFNQAK
ncbi:DUF4942 domain-containing protein [Vibrio vulnificus]|uniref:DUF4942 domain-containing protein n=1 Tax=Vibrio vulnificus TaxID=672 RepID=UPI0010233511|nr:DUF4942 domain-containing protein [Vibrio vulnificus]RZQ33190.1 DUF4942 domain-containing protein [Vibrio vulnificus]